MRSLLTPIFGEDLGRLVDAYASELCAAPCRYGRLQAAPGGDGDVLAGGHHAGELRDFDVEMAMIPGEEDFIFNDVLEPLEVDDEAGGGIRLAGNGDLKRVVVAVAVAIGAA